MASVKKRPDGQWRARYRDVDGKEHAKHFGRKVDADLWVTEQAVSVYRGEHVDPRRLRVTLKSYVDGWLDAQSIRPSSHRTYESYLRNRILPAFGARPIGSITPTDVRGFVKRQSEELAPNTVRAVHNLLAAILTDAVDDGFLTRSPCVRTTPPKPRQAKVVPLTVEQVQALMTAMPERYRATVAVGAGCGLRLGECLGLKVSGVRFLARELDVVEQLVLLPGSPPHLAPLKTASSYRTVPLPQMTALALSAHLAAFPVASDNELVFRSKVGGPVWPNTFRASVWLPACRRASAALWKTQVDRKRAELTASGVRGAELERLVDRFGKDLGDKSLVGIRFHDLRHFTASALIAGGQSVKAVQAVLGHSSAAMTLDVYAGLWPDSDDRSRVAIDAAFAVPADQVRTSGPVSVVQ